MSTTDQPTLDREAPVADAGSWAVPGVDHAPTGEGATPDPAADSGADPVREAAADTEAAVADWRNRFGEAADADAVRYVHPVIAALATCLEALDGIRDAGVGTLDAKEIRLMLLAVVQVITAAFALKLRLIVAGEAQKVEDLTGAASTAAFLGHLTQANRPEAAGEVRLAKALDTRFGLLAAALAAGKVSAEQVKVCVAALRRLPKDVSVDQVQACERFLIDAAQTMTPRQLKLLGRRLWEVIDPDGADAKDGQALEDEERLARAKAYFRSWRNGDGTTGFRGRLPDAQADMLLKLLHAYAGPRRRRNPNIPTSQPDNTTHPDRDPERDAAPESPAGVAPDSPAGGAPCGAEDGLGGSQKEGGGAGPPGPEDPPGGCDGSPADACLDETSAEEEATATTIPYPVRLGHALIDLLERIPGSAVPDSAGAAASVVVTIGADQLATGLGVATLDTGTAVSAGQARRLACGAGIIPMVLAGRSEPLDVGREQRLHTRYQRLAAAHRQHHTCGADGCDRPITDYHHPVPWSHGGVTSSTNCLGLCGYHHHLAHDSGWDLLHNDDTWTFRRIKE